MIVAEGFGRATAKKAKHKSSSFQLTSLSYVPSSSRDSSAPNPHQAGAWAVDDTRTVPAHEVRSAAKFRQAQSRRIQVTSR